MAPAASILSATATAAAASSKRPHASDAEPPPTLQVQVQAGDGAEAARNKGQQQQLECPRCQSTNTKFCYYNNYSTAQPRHFCRACRRYWTHGGTLRDVPVGGASRRSSTGAGGGKRRRVSAEPEPEPPLSSPPPPQTAAAAGADAFLLAPDLPAFPFLSDGSFLMPPPQLDLGGVAQPATLFSSWQSVVPDLYDGLAPWDDDGAAAGMTGPAWGDIAGGLDLSWPPPPGN
jgi:hypothetical protein